MKRSFLLSLQVVYRAVYFFWVLCYRLGVRASYQAKVPVWSVGNLSVGGTGKTPLVDWLVSDLEHRGLKVGLVTRGYGRVPSSEVLVLDQTNQTGGPERFGDEPWMLFKNHPSLVVAVHADRGKGAKKIEDQVQLILMDDGFQHWRLKRDLDLVLMDASVAITENRLLPRGRLREPPGALSRADVLLLTKCNLGNPELLQAWVTPFLSGTAEVIRLGYQPQGLKPITGGPTLSVDTLQGQGVLAFCGIGNPASFKKNLFFLGVKVLEFCILPDHHAYEQSFVDRLKIQKKQLGVKWVVCTEKDAVKLEKLDLGSLGLVSLVMSLTGTEPLRRLIDQKL